MCLETTENTISVRNFVSEQVMMGREKTNFPRIKGHKRMDELKWQQQSKSTVVQKLELILKCWLTQDEENFYLSL